MIKDKTSWTSSSERNLEARGYAEVLAVQALLVRRAEHLGGQADQRAQIHQPHPYSIQPKVHWYSQICEYGYPHIMIKFGPLLLLTRYKETL